MRAMTLNANLVENLTLFNLTIVKEKSVFPTQSKVFIPIYYRATLKSLKEFNITIGQFPRFFKLLCEKVFHDYKLLNIRTNNNHSFIFDGELNNKKFHTLIEFHSSINQNYDYTEDESAEEVLSMANITINFGAIEIKDIPNVLSYIKDLNTNILDKISAKVEYGIYTNINEGSIMSLEKFRDYIRENKLSVDYSSGMVSIFVNLDTNTSKYLESLAKL